MEDPAPPTSRRVFGVDIARALAILGMVMVHVGPTAAGGVAGRVYALPHGRASLLFVLVAGVGVSLLGNSRNASGSRLYLTLAWRALLLLPLGLAIQRLDHGVNVILQTYALLFVIAAVAHARSDRWLLAGAATSVCAGPAIFLWGQLRRPEQYDRTPANWGDPLGEVAHELVLSGPYPVMVWSAPLLLGMWIGRQDLRARSVAIRLSSVGGAVALSSLALSGVLSATVAGPEAARWQQLVASMTPHSQMPLWVLHGTGAAAAVLGATLLITREPGRLARPLVAAGQLALTIYVLHLLVLHLAPELATADEVGAAAWRVSLFAAAMLVGARAWRRTFAQGPLERLLRLPSRSG